MRILLIYEVLNGLTQLALLELRALGHSVALIAATSDEAIRVQARTFKPDLVFSLVPDASMLDSITPLYPCLALRPGTSAQHGSGSLGEAILRGASRWGVRVIELGETQGSDRAWAAAEFPLRSASKSSILRDEFTHNAVRVILDAVNRYANRPSSYQGASPWPRPTPRCTSAAAEPDVRRIDWRRDAVGTILRTIHSADSAPGVLDSIYGMPVYLFGGHEEARLTGSPGEIIAQRNGAICRAGVDGAVWITHLKRANIPQGDSFKLPSAQVLAGYLHGVPEIGPEPQDCAGRPTYCDLWYEERDDVGYVRFDFYNRTLDTDQCRRLERVIRLARRRPTKVIVLFGGRDVWSDGIDLDQIEAAHDPAEEAWRNINAMNDLVLSLLMATDQLTIAALYGGASGGGLMMALATDRVMARDGILLNLNYRGLGGFPGSEYWTYTLPKRVGAEQARRLTEECLPMTARSARSIGIVDEVIQTADLGVDSYGQFLDQIRISARDWVQGPEYEAALRKKQARWQADDWVKPLELYRVAELAEISRILWGSTSRFHRVCSAVVRKQSCDEATSCLDSTDAVCANLYCDKARARMAQRLASVSLE